MSIALDLMAKDWLAWANSVGLSPQILSQGCFDGFRRMRYSSTQWSGNHPPGCLRLNSQTVVSGYWNDDHHQNGDGVRYNSPLFPYRDLLKQMTGDGKRVESVIRKQTFNRGEPK